MKEVGVVYDGKRISIEQGSTYFELKVDGQAVDRMSGLISGGLLTTVLANGDRVSAFCYCTFSKVRFVIQVNGVTVMER